MSFRFFCVDYLLLFFYQFREMVLLPRDHKDRCDRDVVIRKPTGALDGKLLTEFLWGMCFHNVLSYRIFSEENFLERFPMKFLDGVLEGMLFYTFFFIIYISAKIFSNFDRFYSWFFFLVMFYFVCHPQCGFLWMA